MFRKLSILILVIFLFSINSVFAECFFDTYSNDCERFSTAFNEFNLDFDPQDLVKNYSVFMYNKNNPSNRLILEKDGDSFRNVNPFTQPGVYVMEIRTKSSSNVVNTTREEFIFDNSIPSPPQLPLNLKSDTNSIILRGQADPNTEVVIESKATVEPNSQGSFETSISLNSGYNLIKLNTRKDNLESEKIIRIIENDATSEIEPNPYTSGSVTFFDLENLNDRTYTESDTYITSSRNFVIAGSLSGPNSNYVELYVNGEKTRTDQNGDFYHVVLLNEDLNEIKVQIGDLEEVVKVNYLNPKFKFNKIDYDKIVSSSQVSFDVEVNYQLPFNVFLNGELTNSISPSSDQISFNVNNLKEGKNYLYFEGYDGELFFDLIYYDSQEPMIEEVSFSEIANSNELVFEVTDDIGLDINTVLFSLDGQDLDDKNFEIKGNFYIFDITGFADGDYNYEFSIQDHIGNTASKTGQLNIDSQNTLIERLRVNDGLLVGDKIFVDSGSQTLTLIPSRYIAFDKIFMDGEEQVNYEIKANGNVEISLELNKQKGEIKFSFVNNQMEYFTQEFEYYTDEEKPTIYLDYISFSQTYDKEPIFISGRIEDSYFDWDTLKFNGQNYMTRFSNMFEAYAVPNNNGFDNLLISGRDVLGNPIENDIYGSLLYNDIEKVDISFEDYSRDTVRGTYVNQDTRVNQYITNYDGISSIGIMTSENLKLPVNEKYGLRVVNLLGYESSFKPIRDIDPTTIDPLKPKIYFIPANSVNETNIVIDGTLSPVNTQELNITLDGLEPVVISNCSDRVSVNSICRTVENNGVLEVYAEDMSSNSNSKVFDGNYDNINRTSNETYLEIYFEGNDKVTNHQNYPLQGNVRSSSLIESISVEGESCLFDEYNFVCYTKLENLGPNDLEVEVVNEDGDREEKNETVVFDPEGLYISIQNLTNGQIYNVNGNYYTLDTEFDLVGNVSQDARITLLVDNKRILQGENVGVFTIPIDIGYNVAEKNYEEIELQLEAENELGNTTKSPPVLVIFNRVAETIVDIIIG